MICKWCGAALQNTQGACPRCGKSQPPLSQCGGFFDLVPGAQGVAPAQAPSVKQSPGVLWAICAVLAALTLGVLLLCMNLRSQLVYLQEEVEALEERVPAATATQTTTGETSAPDPTSVPDGTTGPVTAT